MLIELPKHTEIFGCIKIHEVQKVLKLESKRFETPLLRGISKDEIDDMLYRLTVIIPVKDEKMHLLDGVLKSIPQGCNIVIVSNSQREEKDIFRMECDLITNFYKVTRHPTILIHQKDPGVALAFKEVGYEKILDKDGLVRDGKGEGMIIGMLLAKILGSEYVGFTDADNYIPCSVNEYIRIYASGFCISNSPYTMIRLHWRYKPKVMGERLYFKKWGRVSEITNKYLNMLLSFQTGFETHIIKTGNAGEHAMSIKLADVMAYSTGYSIEPYHFIYLFEEFWKGETKYREAVSSGIEIYQVETLNPHVHEERGEEHIKEMLLESLSTIYHSRLSNEDIRLKIIEELKSNDVIRRRNEVKKNIIMPPLECIDMNKFIRVLEDYSETLIRFD